MEPLYFLRSERIFLVQGSHQRLRSRSVDENEYIPLEADGYLTTEGEKR